MKQTMVKELMTAYPVLIDPDASLQEAADKMREIDCGVLPVGTNKQLQGIITDRDIVVRAVARGQDIRKEKVRDYMTDEIFFCKEDDTLEQAADLMGKHKVSRLIVKDKAGTVTGILTFGCILREDSDMEEITSVVMHATQRAA